MRLERVESCPICSGKSFKLLHTCKDYTTSGELFHVEQCNTCGLNITNPRPLANIASSYYQSDDYISHQKAGKGWFDSIYLIIRRLTASWKIRLVRKHSPAALLLDFGCGTGYFVQQLVNTGVKAFGVEPSAEARSAAPKGLAIKSSIEELSSMKFDAITLWHVLEHTYDPQATLEKIKARLVEDGTIFIAVPNWESYDATHYQEMWAAFDVPRHLWHFSKSTMKSLLQNSGLRLMEIIPMKLDAYYVSILSEKNQRQGMSLIGFVAGLLTGLRSNLKAGKEINYSSLIYVVKR